MEFVLLSHWALAHPTRHIWSAQRRLMEVKWLSTCVQSLVDADRLQNLISQYSRKFWSSRGTWRADDCCWHQGNLPRTDKLSSLTEFWTDSCRVQPPMLSAISRARVLSRHAAVRRVRWVSQVPPQNPPPKAPEASEGASTASETREPASSLAEADSTTSTAGKLPSLDFMPGEPQEEQPKRTGARSSKGTLSSTEKKRKVMSRVLLAMLASGLAGYTVYLGREWEEEELKAKRLVSASICFRWASFLTVGSASRMHLRHGGVGPRNGLVIFSTWVACSFCCNFRWTNRTIVLQQTCLARTASSAIPSATRQAVHARHLSGRPPDHINMGCECNELSVNSLSDM